MPHDRSMPAVSMISVWPMAMTPTTITCCKISEKFWPLKKRSDSSEKNRPAASRAKTGPSTVTAGRARVKLDLITGYSLKEARAKPERPWPPRRVESTRLFAPAGAQAEAGVLAVDAGHGLVADQRDAGVDVAAGLLAGLGVGHAGLDAHGGHLQRILLRSGGDDAGLDVAHAGAAAVDRHDQHAFFLAGGFQRLVGAGGGRFIDGVDQVDVGIFLQAVFHRRLALALIAVAVGHADHVGGLAQAHGLRVDIAGAEAGQEAVVAGDADRMAGEQVQRGDPGRLAAERGLGVLADQQARLVIIGGEQR